MNDYEQVGGNGVAIEELHKGPVNDDVTLKGLVRSGDIP